MGAPKGNTNALKHGLYARHFTPEEQAWLRKMSPQDLRHELYMVRKAVDGVYIVQQRILARIDATPASSDPEDEDRLARVTNSLAIAVTALNNTARTCALFSGADATLNDPLDDALSRLPIFLDDHYLNETNSDENDEVLVE